MAARTPVEDDLLTIDELATATGLTVRTARYYASLGLLPPPVRRGRMAFYGPAHLARLEMVRALQEHGFTLAAIERYLTGVPMDASPVELAVQRALLTAWKPTRWEVVTRPELEARAGRPLSDDDLEWLTRAGGVLKRLGNDLQVSPLVDNALALIELDMPIEGIIEARAAVRRHMSELADELTEVLRSRVLSRYDGSGLSMEDARRLEQTLTALRALTLEAIVATFQTAANQLATRSLTVDAEHQRSS